MLPVNRRFRGAPQFAICSSQFSIGNCLRPVRFIVPMRVQHRRSKLPTNLEVRSCARECAGQSPRVDPAADSHAALWAAMLPAFNSQFSICSSQFSIPCPSREPSSIASNFPAAEEQHRSALSLLGPAHRGPVSVFRSAPPAGFPAFATQSPLSAAKSSPVPAETPPAAAESRARITKFPSVAAGFPPVAAHSRPAPAESPGPAAKSPEPAAQARAGPARSPSSPAKFRTVAAKSRESAAKSRVLAPKWPEPPTKSLPFAAPRLAPLPSAIPRSALAIPHLRWIPHSAFRLTVNPIDPPL
jgi:hypothetical protein